MLEVGLRGRIIYDWIIYDVRFGEEDYREDKGSANEMIIDVLVIRDVLGRMRRIRRIGQIGLIRQLGWIWTNRMNRNMNATTVTDPLPRIVKPALCIVFV